MNEIFVLQAARFAALKHKDQLRKGSEPFCRQIRFFFCQQ